MAALDERTVPINLRVPKPQKDLIDRAAQVTGKTRTDFILEAAAREAEDVVLERRLFSLGKEQYERFLAALDAPVQPNPKLAELMKVNRKWKTMT